jgi:hypothetical protein
MAKTRPRPRRSGGARAAAPRAAQPVFARTNYMILLASVGLIVLGFTIMRVENEVDGFLSLYVSPLLIVGGYVGVLAAILWRPRPVPEAEAA